MLFPFAKWGPFQRLSAGIHSLFSWQSPWPTETPSIKRLLTHRCGVGKLAQRPQRPRSLPTCRRQCATHFAWGFHPAPPGATAPKQGNCRGMRERIFRRLARRTETPFRPPRQNGERPAVFPGRLGRPLRSLEKLGRRLSVDGFQKFPVRRRRLSNLMRRGVAFGVEGRRVRLASTRRLPDRGLAQRGGAAASQIRRGSALLLRPALRTLRT